MDILRDSLIALAKSKRVWFLQIVVNPVLMAAAALWLLIPEAQAWQIVVTVLAILIIVLMFLWLHAATFAYFANFHADGSARIRGAFRPANLAAFALWALGFAFLLHVVQHVYGEFQSQLSSYLRSISPLWLRRNISESRMDALLALKFWIVFWILIPALTLPFGLQTARHGFSGFGKQGRRGWRNTAGSRVYWSTLIVMAVVGVYLPQLLIEWLPRMAGVSGETVSLVLRISLAWLLTATAWTFLASVLGCLGDPASRTDVVRKSTY